MNDLLELALSAHGGINHWNSLRHLRVHLAIARPGRMKNDPVAKFDDILVNVETHRQWVSIESRLAPDRISVFEPDRISLEKTTGKIIQYQHDPQSKLVMNGGMSSWNTLQIAYFKSYSLWGMLTQPFLFASYGFSTIEMSTWKENGEEWRRLRVIYPVHYIGHTREQTFYFSEDGLLRRHDFNIDIMGGLAVVDYPSKYRSFDGIHLATNHRVYSSECQVHPEIREALMSVEISNASYV